MFDAKIFCQFHKTVKNLIDIMRPTVICLQERYKALHKSGAFFISLYHLCYFLLKLDAHTFNL